MVEYTNSETARVARCYFTTLIDIAKICKENGLPPMNPGLCCAAVLSCEKAAESMGRTRCLGHAFLIHSIHLVGWRELSAEVNRRIEED